MNVDDRDATFDRLRAVPFEELKSDGSALPSESAPVDASSAAFATSTQESHGSNRSGAIYEATPADPPFHLRHPFVIDGVRYDRLLFRAPAFEDVEAVMHGRISELEMHARMADVPVSVLRALRWVDSEIAHFIARSLAPEIER